MTSVTLFNWLLYWAIRAQSVILKKKCVSDSSWTFKYYWQTFLSEGRGECTLLLRKKHRAEHRWSIWKSIQRAAEISFYFRGNLEQEVERLLLSLDWVYWLIVLFSTEVEYTYFEENEVWGMSFLRRTQNNISFISKDNATNWFWVLKLF